MCHFNCLKNAARLKSNLFNSWRLQLSIVCEDGKWESPISYGSYIWFNMQYICSCAVLANSAKKAAKSDTYTIKGCYFYKKYRQRCSTISICIKYEWWRKYFHPCRETIAPMKCSKCQNKTAFKLRGNTISDDCIAEVTNNKATNPIGTQPSHHKNRSFRWWQWRLLSYKQKDIGRQTKVLNHVKFEATKNTLEYGIYQDNYAARPRFQNLCLPYGSKKGFWKWNAVVATKTVSKRKKRYEKRSSRDAYILNWDQGAGI